MEKIISYSSNAWKSINWKKLKDDYTKILFAENTTNDKIKAILKQCNYSIFFRNTKFKNYNKLSEEKKENLINETINSCYNCFGKK